MNQEQLDDLTWLARNVHKWPDRSCGYINIMEIKGVYHPSWSRYSGDGKFSKRQWLARRAELQNKPSWEDAPEWAQWLSQDSLGRWLWHERKPRADDVRFKPRRGVFHVECTGEALGSWRDTLERRPDEVKDFQPFVSVEDAQPDMVNHPPHYQSDNGIECIDAIRAALGLDGFIAYCIGNAMKYQWRNKNDKLEDMKKARWYMDKAIKEQSK